MVCEKRFMKAAFRSPSTFQIIYLAFCWPVYLVPGIFSLLTALILGESYLSVCMVASASRILFANTLRVSVSLKKRM